MIAQESTVKTREGIDLLVRRWSPEVTPRGVVQIVHGLGEHSGRYLRVAAALLDQGLAVIAWDHRGHGRSGGLRGHVDGFEQYSDDLRRVFDLGVSAWPGAFPRFIYGHSLGGLIALHARLDAPDLPLRGMILSNPALREVLETPGWKRLLGRALSRLAPQIRLHTGLAPERISRDPAEVKAYAQDPLIHDLVSTRFYTSYVAAMTRVHDAPQGISLPTLWLISGSDRICDPEANRRFAAALGPTTTVREWAESYHEGHNDLQREEVAQAVRMWLGTQIGP